MGLALLNIVLIELLSEFLRLFLLSFLLFFLLWLVKDRLELVRIEEHFSFTLLFIDLLIDFGVTGYEMVDSNITFKIDLIEFGLSGYFVR